MKKAYIYTRSATSPNKDSLNFQERALRKFARKNKYLVSGVFTDEGVSGNSKRRPGLSKLFNHCEIAHVDAVLFYSIDRIGRDMGAINFVINKLDLLKTRAICLGDDIEDLRKTFLYQAMFFARINSKRGGN